jgi:hypothetical protein
MGGFTTYSTFNYETVELLREGAVGLAGLNVAATVVLCLLGGAVGATLARWILGESDPCACWRARAVDGSHPSSGRATAGRAGPCPMR